MWTVGSFVVMNTKTFTVKGMTCGNCVRHVTEEVSGVVGVTTVDVTLETGAVVVTADGSIDDSAIEAAVVEAGYELVK
jgi:copper chaperone